MDFERAMVSFDDAVLLSALMELKNGPDWKAENDDERLAEWDRIADALRTINFTVPEFQDVVSKSPSAMIKWLALQLRISIVHVQKLATNPIFADPNVDDLRADFERRVRAKLHAVDDPEEPTNPEGPEPANDRPPAPSGGDDLDPMGGLPKQEG